VLRLAAFVESRSWIGLKDVRAGALDVFTLAVATVAGKVAEPVVWRPISTPPSAPTTRPKPPNTAAREFINGDVLGKIAAPFPALEQETTVDL
jgi:hypothetical protein